MKVTFLAALKPLIKKFTPQGICSYPLAKNFTSHEYFIPATYKGMAEKFSLITHHAAQGHALYKGNLTQPLKNESRKGKTDKEEKTHSLILDVDGLPLDEPLPTPITSEVLKQAANKFILSLPNEFHNTSCIAQGSASMGRNPKKLNLHIEFFTDHAISPKALKHILVDLNLTCSTLITALTLTASGTGLSYTLDPCIADNSRLLYIAPPKFTQTPDPFESPNARHVLIEKEHETLRIMPLIEAVNPEKTSKEVAKHVKNLRKANGLGAKKQKTQRLHINNQEYISVVTNPDKITLDFVSDNDQWLQFNRTGGDSRGYYVAKDSPAILRNFKGEDNILLSKADPETYQWILDNYPNTETDSVVPFCFRDFETNTLYNGFHHPLTLQPTQIAETTAGNIAGFFKDYGYEAPEIIPQMEYTYRPHRPPEVDLKNRFVNAYIASEYATQNEIALPERIEKTFGTAGTDLATLCPTIHKIIAHVTGDSDEGLERFVNWFAYIVKYRKKTQTSWLFHGVPGTGKGVLYDKIIRPILGKTNCSLKTIANLDDEKNKWIEDTLFVMIDEFRYADSTHWERMYQRLKSLIHDEEQTVRGMRANQRTIRCYVNFIFCSNNIDAMRVTEGDRRFNICPRQNTTIEKRYPDIREAIGHLDNELPFFAEYLKTFDVNKKMVKRTWENETKVAMRELTKTTPELFVEALKKGDLEFFLPILEETPTTTADMDIKILIDRTLRNALPHVGEKTRISCRELSFLYTWQSGHKIAVGKLTKLLGYNGITPKRMRLDNGGIMLAVNVLWRLKTLNQRALCAHYIPDNVTPINEIKEIPYVG